MKNKICLILVVLLFTVFGLGSGSSSSDSDKSSSNVSAGSDASTKTSATIDEQVIFDQEGVTITAKEIVEDSIWGQGIKILIENNSNNDITVTADAMAVNGYMITDYLYEDVTSGSKANATMYCLSTELENAGIDSIGEVDVWFKLINPNTYDTIYEQSEPTIIKTSAFDTMDTSLNIDGVEVMNQNGVKAVVQYVDEDSFWGTSVLVYIENNSSDDIYLSSDNMSINGFMVNGYLYSYVKAGYKAFDEITVFESDLEDNDIDSIDSIKLNFSCINANTFSSFNSDSVTIDVNK